jgi:hypothetical protein
VEAVDPSHKGAHGVSAVNNAMSHLSMHVMKMEGTSPPLAHDNAVLSLVEDLLEFLVANPAQIDTEHCWIEL